MSFPSKYSGWCGLCGESFARGESIQRMKPVDRKVPTKTERYQPASEFEMRPRVLKFRHVECHDEYT